MKLAQLAPSRIALGEGRVDPNVLMSIQNLAAGSSNTFALIVLARMLEMLRQGVFYSETNFLEVSTETHKDTLATLRVMDKAELTKLAGRMLALLNTKDKDELRSFANPAQDSVSWIRWVTSKEAND